MAPLQEQERQRLRNKSAEMRLDPSKVTPAELVEQFGPMVRKAAGRYRNELPHFDREDMEQELYARLLQAWPSYDPAKGAVSTWGWKVIRSWASRCFQDQTWRKSGNDRGRSVHSIYEDAKAPKDASDDSAIDAFDAINLGALTKVERFVCLAIHAGYSWTEISDALGQTTRDRRSISKIMVRAAAKLGHVGTPVVLHKSKHDLKPVEIAWILERYEAGESAAALGRALDIGPQVILAVLRAKEVEIRR